MSEVVRNRFNVWWVVS